jgi:hypothetical protein
VIGIDNSRKPHIIMRQFTILCFAMFIGIAPLCHGSIFTIQSLRVGPNPLRQNHDSLIINYLSNKDHTIEYFIYSPTGRLLYHNSRNYPTKEHRYELASQLFMASLPKQVVVVVLVFTSGNEKIIKKKYVVVK